MISKDFTKKKLTLRAASKKTSVNSGVDLNAIVWFPMQMDNKCQGVSQNQGHD